MMEKPAKTVDTADHFNCNSSPELHGWMVKKWMTGGAVMKVKPMGMLLMMLSGWTNRYQQDSPDEQGDGGIEYLKILCHASSSKAS
jgi:hypothetical protein